MCVYTGHDSHHSISIDAMRAEKHVAVEKPMAISVRAAQRMCDVAEETGLVLSVDENAHFNPATRASAWAVNSGLIGHVQMVYRGVIGFRGGRPDLVAARTPWRQSKFGAGGGVAIDLGVHLFNGVRPCECGECVVACPGADPDAAGRRGPAGRERGNERGRRCLLCQFYPGRRGHRTYSRGCR